MELKNWKLFHDEKQQGLALNFPEAVAPDARDAVVPGLAQTVWPGKHGVFWYWTEFAPFPLKAHQRAELRFGAADYAADVWLNGKKVGRHEGGETPFRFDVTGFLKDRNLLCVRLVNPTGQVYIDGLTLKEIPHANKLDEPEYMSGSSLNTGGLFQPVVLEAVPDVRFTDIYCVASVKDGVIRAEGTLFNASSRTAAAECSATVDFIRTDERCGGKKKTLKIAPGSAKKVRFVIPVRDVRLWELSDPCLYLVALTVKTAHVSDRITCRTGFRELKVEHGYFYLNGKRIFLKSTHTGNHYPGSRCMPGEADRDFLRRDLILAKAEGLNMVRFIAQTALPEQLDFCDEIGLMVYEENLTAWNLGPSAQAEKIFHREQEAMILRDRNHPCLTIWGLLNEERKGMIFDIARSSLGRLRRLDPTRLVLLSSGRWDDMPQCGSFSNPGSDRWEFGWGGERADFPEKPSPEQSDPWRWEWWDRMGDVHIYPGFPITHDDTAMLRHLGHEGGPVFLSECGIGSAFNIPKACRHFEERGTDPEIFDFKYARRMLDLFLADWRRWGFDGIYPFPEDFFEESERHHARQRRLLFDIVRSNPRFCGWNLTGMLDHALTGEGLWGLFREWKEGFAEVLADGLAPLRWCLFSGLAPVYEGKPVHLEAVLANEGVLRPGKYNAVFRIFAEDRGVLWEKKVPFAIEPEGNGVADAPLASSVLDENVRIGLTPGEYVFAAELESGGSACSGRRTFRVVPAMLRVPEKTCVMAAALNEVDLAFFRRLGLKAADFDPKREKGLLILGHGKEHAENADDPFWSDVRNFLNAGGNVLACAASAFPDGDAGKVLAPDRTIRYQDGWISWDWLYHKETVFKRDPLFDGVAPAGLLDWDISSVLARGGVWRGSDPDTVLAAAFGTGLTNLEGYLSGIKLGEYRVGKGILMMNALNLPPDEPNHNLPPFDVEIPAADRLFLNLIARLG